MAPIKFEEEIKDKLEARRIEPSVESWDKLATKLDKDGKSGINRFWWLAIAASFLLVLFTVIQVSKSPEEGLPQDSFSIEEPSKLDVLEDSTIKEKEFFDLDVQEIQGIADYEKQEPASKLIEEPEKTSIYVAKNDVELENPEVKVNDGITLNSRNQETEEMVASNEIDESLIQEVLNDAKNQSEKNLDRETDSLLKAAQKELLMDKAMIEKSTVVNANELLMEIEDEVEPSLKSKVYEVFKGGFKKVKTAVAQRNN